MFLSATKFVVFVTAAVRSPYTIFEAFNKPPKFLPNTEPHTCCSCDLSHSLPPPHLPFYLVSPPHHVLASV